MSFSISYGHMSKVHADLRIRFDIHTNPESRPGARVVPLKNSDTLLMRFPLRLIPGDNASVIAELTESYRQVLRHAENLGARTVAVPVTFTLSSVNDNLSIQAILKTVYEAVRSDSRTAEMKIIIVISTGREIRLTGELGDEVDSFVRNNMKKPGHSAYVVPPINTVYELWTSGDSTTLHSIMGIPHESTSLFDMLSLTCKITFRTRLFELIDARHMTDSEVYHIANLDRKLFSKIRCKPNYCPRKRTILALAVALQLTLEETVDLLASAGRAFSLSDEFDLIVIWFLMQKHYDIFEINLVLFNHNLPPLGTLQ